MTVKVGVLALQGDVAEHASALTDCGAHVVEVRSPGDLAGVDGVLLPGGESTTISMLIDKAGLFDPLAARLADGLAAFGTCAGMILLAAEVLDGRPDQRSFAAIDIGVRRNAFGRQAQSFEAALDVAGLPGGEGPFDAVFIRAPAVERVGRSVEVLASVDGRPVLCRQGPVVVAAFHPELSSDLRVHRLFLDTCEG